MGGAFDGEVRTLGNAGRNTLINPGFAQLDFSLSKNTNATEDLNIEFKVEGFNLLNRVNLGGVRTRVFDDDGDFESDIGRINSSPRRAPAPVRY